MKHNLTKTNKANESIEAHQKKKHNLVNENLKHEKDLPVREREQQSLV